MFVDISKIKTHNDTDRMSSVLVTLIHEILEKT